MDLVDIDRGKLPPEEHKAAETVKLNLIHIQIAAQDFRHTVELYLFAHDRKLAGEDNSRRMIAWMKLAGRSGAILAYSIHRVMQAINAVNAPTLRALVNMKERNQATSLFDAEFPNIAGIRTSAAHPGELTDTENKLANHRLKKAMVSGLGYFGAGSYIVDGMNAYGDHLIFSASFDGKPAQYELSMKKADVLDKVTRHYCRAFYPLEGATAALQRERMR